jgi:membrane-bound serine protease (ClpP class)
MTLIILLFSVGIVLLAVEVIVPGAILGSIGGLMMFGGCVLSFMEYGTGGGLIAVTVALALTFLTLFIEFRVLPRTAVGKRAFLKSEITGVSAAFGEEARDLIGKSAEALTMLSPSGYIRIDGKRYEAFCQSGQVPAGSPLEVIGADNFRLIVSLTKTN